MGGNTTDRRRDVALARACIDGEQSAWQRLVETHETTVYYAIRNALRSRGRHAPEHLLTELQAEVFFRVVRDDFARLRRYGGRSSLKHWLKVVASNFVIDYLRKRRPNVSLDDPDAEALSRSLRSSHPAPDQSLVRGEAKAVLAELLEELKPADRRFVELFYEQELSFDAVAEAMNTSVGAIYSRKNRVTAKLTSLLKRRESLAGLKRSNVRDRGTR